MKYTNNTLINTCVELSVVWADTQFHYSDSQQYKPVWSERSEKRLKLKNLQGYCDERRVKGKLKSNQYEAPYHGRGEYYLYLPYLLGLALQFDKGYMIDNLALRNDNIMYQQINFDMLINLSGLYEDKKGKVLSRKEYSYLILGMALHLVEDLWAHVAVINDDEEKLDELNKPDKSRGGVGCFLYLEDLKRLRYTEGKPICYLNMAPFCRPKKKGENGEKDIDYYNITHRKLAEGSELGSGGAQRKIHAQNAAVRLLGYYKNGYIMHSGNQKLTGTNQANQTDRKRLGISKCAKATLNPTTITLKNGKPVTYGRYVCGACENGNADSCYRIYYSDKKKGRGLGYMPLRFGNAN